MKKNRSLTIALIPLVITISLYSVFEEKITCQPKDAGFWIILALGMSLGLVILSLVKHFWQK